MTTNLEEGFVIAFQGAQYIGLHGTQWLANLISIQQIRIMRKSIINKKWNGNFTNIGIIEHEEVQEFVSSPTLRFVWKNKIKKGIQTSVRRGK